MITKSTNPEHQYLLATGSNRRGWLKIILLTLINTIGLGLALAYLLCFETIVAYAIGAFQ